MNFFWNTFIQMWCLLLAVRIYKPCEGKPEIWSWTLEGFKHRVKMSVANSFLLDRYLEELKHNMANSGKGKLPKTLYWMWNFFSYNWFVSWSYFNSFVLWSCSATVLLQLLFSRKIVMCVFLWETVSVFVKMIGQMKNKVESRPTNVTEALHSFGQVLTLRFVLPCRRRSPHFGRYFS